MIKSLLLISITLFLCISCAVVPVKKLRTQKDYACGITTHEWDLKMVKIGHLSATCNTPECILSVGLVSAATTGITAVVSGSIVLVGNMVHWIEQQGPCNNENIEIKVEENNKRLIQQGGKQIKTVKELEYEIEE